MAPNTTCGAILISTTRCVPCRAVRGLVTLTSRNTAIIFRGKVPRSVTKVVLSRRGRTRFGRVLSTLSFRTRNTIGYTHMNGKGVYLSSSVGTLVGRTGINTRGVCRTNLRYVQEGDTAKGCCFVRGDDSHGVRS